VNKQHAIAVPCATSTLRSTLTVLLLVLPLLGTMPARADHGTPPDNKSHDLAKASQNPISSLISVPFENNANFNVGPDNSYQNVLNIKPVVPMKLNDSWSLVNRAIIPLIYLDDQRGSSTTNSSQFAAGDPLYQGFFTPGKPGKIIWGIGPSIGLPLGGNRFSTNKYLLGPNAVVLTMPGHWVIGALVSNVWSVAGDDDAANVNEFTAQYFINYNLSGGWYVKTTPVITADWQAPSDQRWTVPVGGGFGRIFKIGNQHLKADVQGFVNAVKPDHANDWTFQATLTFLFPK